MFMTKKKKIQVALLLSELFLNLVPVHPLFESSNENITTHTYLTKSMNSYFIRTELQCKQKTDLGRTNVDQTLTWKGTDTWTRN